MTEIALLQFSSRIQHAHAAEGAKRCRENDDCRKYKFNIEPHSDQMNREKGHSPPSSSSSLLNVGFCAGCLFAGGGGAPHTFSYQNQPRKVGAWLKLGDHKRHKTEAKNEGESIWQPLLFSFQNDTFRWPCDFI